MPSVKVLCSKCRREFVSPFKPREGAFIVCFPCKILNVDMSKTAYMEALVVTLMKNLSLKKKDIIIAKQKSASYTVLSGSGKSSELLFSIVWSAKYPAQLTPNIAVAKFENIDPRVKKIIADFIKRQGIEMDELEVPSLSYRL